VTSCCSSSPARTRSRATSWARKDPFQGTLSRVISSQEDIIPARPSTNVPLPVRRTLRDIGGDIQTWRKLRGLTQSQVADRAGIDRKSVGRVERGDGAVSLEVVLRVLNALGVMDGVAKALDPYETDVGRLRADDQLPQRVRPRGLE
jgi:DNA-binding XRE family transcriptional regulator